MPFKGRSEIHTILLVGGPEAGTSLSIAVNSSLRRDRQISNSQITSRAAACAAVTVTCPNRNRRRCCPVTVGSRRR